MTPLWSREQGIEFCRVMEEIAPLCGGHVALTGGRLYKDGVRKDCDVLVYRIRQVERFDWPLFFQLANRRAGVIAGKDNGWCKKASLPDGRMIDFFDPEDDGVYGAETDNVFQVLSPPFTD